VGQGSTAPVTSKTGFRGPAGRAYFESLRSVTGEVGYRQLLGEYLARWLEIEDLLNYALARMFEPIGTSVEALRRNAIDHLPFRRRLAALKTLAPTAHRTDVRNLVRRLQKASDRRNELAHLYPEFADSADAHFTLGRHTLTHAELFAEAEDLGALGDEALRVMIAVLNLVPPNEDHHT
jgi:hypothetical protein